MPGRVERIWRKRAHRGPMDSLDGARVAVGGELTPCERMDEAMQGLQNAMRPEWGGGVFGQVITSGAIRVGDVVEWEDASSESR